MAEEKKSPNKLLFGLWVAVVLILVIIFVPKVSTKSETTTSTARSVKLIPGLAAVDVHGNLTDKGFTLEKELSANPSRWTCTETTSSYEYIAVAYGKMASQITKIDATVLNYSTKDTGEIAVDFIGYIATLPYDGSSPAQAREWVKNNINNSTTTIIGTVKFEIFANSARSRILTMTPI